MPKIPSLIRLYCKICGQQTIHIKTITGGLECVLCRATGRETIQLIKYPSKVNEYEKSKLA